jgi:hypothetical protein
MGKSWEPSTKYPNSPARSWKPPFTKPCSRGDDPAIRVIEDPNATPGMRFYATRDIESFDGQHGSTAMEAKQRLVVFEASGDVVELPE